MEVDGETTKLDILDTAGEERYANIRSKQLKEGHGFMLVFSLNDRASFYSIRRYYQEICTAHENHHDAHASIQPTRPHSAEDEKRNHLSALLANSSYQQRYSDPPLYEDYSNKQLELQVGIILVGTGADLTAEHDRAVTREEIDALAKELHLNYFEVSCKNHRQVGISFTDVVRQCRKVNLEDCYCGAADAHRRGKKHAPCICRDECGDCHRRRGLHRPGTCDEQLKHPFVESNDSRERLHTQQQCCAIQ